MHPFFVVNIAPGLCVQRDMWQSREYISMLSRDDDQLR